MLKKKEKEKNSMVGKRFENPGGYQRRKILDCKDRKVLFSISTKEGKSWSPYILNPNKCICSIQAIHSWARKKKERR